MAITKRRRLQWLIQRTGRGRRQSVDVPTDQVSSPPPTPNPPIPAETTPAAEPEPDPQSAGVALAQAVDFARDLQPGHLAVERSAVSNVLYQRLSQEEVAEVERRLLEAPELMDHYAKVSTTAERSFLILTYGLWLAVEAVSQKTGLTAVQPPEEVHAMARGPLAAAGG